MAAAVRELKLTWALYFPAKGELGSTRPLPKIYC